VGRHRFLRPSGEMKIGNIDNRHLEREREGEREMGGERLILRIICLFLGRLNSSISSISAS